VRNDVAAPVLELDLADQASHAAGPAAQREVHLVREVRGAVRRAQRTLVAPGGEVGRRARVALRILAGGAVLALGYVAFDWVAGLVWFLGKTYAFVFVFVWMRGTLPRVRIDQLMGFAWKWLLPASLLNLFVTAAAVVVVGT